MNNSDAAFLKAVESCEIESLSHRDHVRLAWLVLHQEESLASAISTLRGQLRSYASSKGSPEVYHETITWTFVILISERIQRGLGGDCWKEFLTLNPDLTRGKAVVSDFYDEGLLDTEIARRTFILPNTKLKSSANKLRG